MGCGQSNSQNSVVAPAPNPRITPKHVAAPAPAIPSVMLNQSLKELDVSTGRNMSAINEHKNVALPELDHLASEGFAQARPQPQINEEAALIKPKGPVQPDNEAGATMAQSRQPSSNFLALARSASRQKSFKEGDSLGVAEQHSHSKVQNESLKSPRHQQQNEPYKSPFHRRIENSMKQNSFVKSPSNSPNNRAAGWTGQSIRVKEPDSPLRLNSAILDQPKKPQGSSRNILDMVSHKSEVHSIRGSQMDEEEFSRRQNKHFRPNFGDRLMPVRHMTLVLDRGTASKAVSKSNFAETSYNKAETLKRSQIDTEKDVSNNGLDNDCVSFQSIVHPRENVDLTQFGSRVKQLKNRMANQKGSDSNLLAKLSVDKSASREASLNRHDSEHRDQHSPRQMFPQKDIQRSGTTEEKVIKQVRTQGELRNNTRKKSYNGDSIRHNPQKHLQTLFVEDCRGKPLQSTALLPSQAEQASLDKNRDVAQENAGLSVPTPVDDVKDTAEKLLQAQLIRVDEDGHFFLQLNIPENSDAGFSNSLDSRRDPAEMIQLGGSFKSSRSEGPNSLNFDSKSVEGNLSCGFER
jgi:hypothetical protein